MGSQNFLPTDLLGWLINGISDGLAVIFPDQMIFENDSFRRLIKAVANRAETSLLYVDVPSSPLPTKERTLNDAAAWNDQPLGTRWTRRYR